MSRCEHYLILTAIASYISGFASLAPWGWISWIVPITLFALYIRAGLEEK